MWKLWKFYTKVEVAEHERILLFRRDNFVRVLMPGVWRLWDPMGRLHTDKYDLTNPVFEHPIDGSAPVTDPIEERHRRRVARHVVDPVHPELVAFDGL